MGKGDDMKSKNIYKIYSLFIFLIVIMFMQLTFVSAIETLGTFKQSDCVQLIQTCSNCSYNNISSVLYPNSTQALGQVAMVKTGTNFVYTFCNTSSLGSYIVNGFGDVEGTLTVWAYDFEITTTGNSNNNTIPLFLALGGFIILIFAFALKNNYLGFMSGILFIILGIYVIIYGLGFISDLYTQTVGYVSIGMGLFIFLASAYSAINETGINLLGKSIGGDGDDD
jgi:hypothetical protein